MDKLYSSSNGVDTATITPDQLNTLTESTEQFTKSIADSTAAIKEELELINKAITTWEKIVPQLYLKRKRLLLCDELLSGKRNVDTLSSNNGIGGDDQPERKKRGPAKGTKVFVRRKSEILTDEVIGKIRDFIGQDENYHKSKEIYQYLIENNIIQPFPGETPERAFAIALSRVDQDQLQYNNHYSILAWGLPDFGTSEHARRKALKNTVRGDRGTRVSSYGPEERVG
jgi:hypothetical protein